MPAGGLGRSCSLHLHPTMSSTCWPAANDIAAKAARDHAAPLGVGRRPTKSPRRPRATTQRCPSRPNCWPTANGTGSRPGQGATHATIVGPRPTTERHSATANDPTAQRERPRPRHPPPLRGRSPSARRQRADRHPPTAAQPKASAHCRAAEASAHSRAAERRPPTAARPIGQPSPRGPRPRGRRPSAVGHDGPVSAALRSASERDPAWWPLQERHRIAIDARPQQR
jgi:hypothetical protein